VAQKNQKRFKRQDAVALFRRFKAGEGFAEIAVSLSTSPGHIHQIMARYGGIEPKPHVRGRRAL
jgi:hypothetical protein